MRPVRKFCFTLVGRLLSFEGKLNRTHTVSPHCSRKSFLGRLGGLLAAFGLAPTLVARMGAGSIRPPAAPAALRPEPRAVSRKEGSF